MPKKILLADDSITIQKVVELTFSDGDYEVIATNNGARAIQKLSEMRPDIILSDIIMPEKNGYEVCEYVKSHPEYRNIPVILLTGTFEPFDPDRAEKAGCDAVVTKPFESQSLIHKVDELIAQAASREVQPSFEAASPAPTAIDSPFADEAMGDSAGETRAWPLPSFAGQSEPSGGSPFDEMPSFDEQPAAIDEATPEYKPHGDPLYTQDESPLDETFASAPLSDDTFGSSSFDEQPAAFDEATPAYKPHGDPLHDQDESPLDETFASAPSADSAFGSSPFSDEPETHDAGIFSGAAPSEPEELPFEESPIDTYGGGETIAFPKMSFNDLQSFQQQSESAAPEESPEVSDHDLSPTIPFDSGRNAELSFERAPHDGDSEMSPAEPDAFAMNHVDEFGGFGSPDNEQQSMSDPDQAAGAWDNPVEKPSTEWSSPVATDEPADQEFASDEAADSIFEAPATHREDFFDTSEPAEDEVPAHGSASPDEQVQSPQQWSMTSPPSVTPKSPTLSEPLPPEIEGSPYFRPEPGWKQPSPAATVAAPAVAAASVVGVIKNLADLELSDEQVDRIARRVVEMMSEQIVRNIAWEVIPDLASIIVKERIKELEQEA